MTPKGKTKPNPLPRIVTFCSPRYPISTYRIQFKKNFSLRRAVTLVQYLNEMENTNCFTSPFFQVRPGSMHDYDVINYSIVYPDLSGEAALRRFTQNLRKHKMGMLMDIVPNHMCIAPSSTNRWNNVLS